MIEKKEVLIEDDKDDEELKRRRKAELELLLVGSGAVVEKEETKKNKKRKNAMLGWVAHPVPRQLWPCFLHRAFPKRGPFRGTVASLRRFWGRNACALGLVFLSGLEPLEGQ